MKLLNKLKEYPMKEGKVIYDVGFNIKKFDLPMIAGRLYRRRMASFTESMYLVISGKMRIEDEDVNMAYLDLLDISKALVFPRLRGVNAGNVARALSKYSDGMRFQRVGNP